MYWDWGAAWPFLIPISAIIASFVYAIVRTIVHARVRELEVRERIAMIERGLVPPPEVDPPGFDRAMEGYERVRRARHEFRNRDVPGRHRRAGIILIGLGFGMMILLSTTSGESGSGLGIGGFLVVLGLAFYLSSLFEAHHQPPVSHAYPAQPPATYPPKPPQPPASPTDRPPARQD
jgi:hypothetical protein